MKVRELIERLEDFDVDQESEIWVMSDKTRVEPEVFIHKRLGVVIM